MDKNEALGRFYAHNHINITAASDPADGNYDPRIAGLSDQVDRWLARIPPENHDLLLTLLSRYHYLTEPVCQSRYVRIVELLKERIQGKCSLNQVLFLIVEPRSGTASGGDNVSSDLRKRNYPDVTKSQIIRVQSKLTEKRLRDFRAVVFVDDVLGSGITLWGTIAGFRARFPSLFQDGTMLFYSGIVLREEGVEHIDDNCRSEKITVMPLLDSEWYEEPAFPRGSAEFKTLDRFERLVGYYMVTDPQKSFFMGFCKNRLLVSLHYNTPNNTLSSFWRDTPDNEPPFPRDGDQPPKRPIPTEMREQTRQTLSGAYAFGMDKLEKRHG